MAIEYTLKMVNTLKSIKNKFALTDEDVRLMLSEEYNIHISETSFKRHIAEVRNLIQEEKDLYIEETSKMTLKINFYKEVLRIKHGIRAGYQFAYDKAFEDETGKTMIDFLSRVHIKQQPQKIEAQVVTTEMSREDREERIKELLSKMNNQGKTP